MKHLGIIRHRYAQPLFDGLRKSASDSPKSFELVQDASVQLVLKLLQDELDGAFLSSIDYAKHYSHLQIIPEVGIVSIGESRLIELHFREDLQNISTIAINPESSSEIVLARLLLEEKFDIIPKFIPMLDAIHEGLEKADSVLLVGNDCEEWKGHTNKLDLVDEWFDFIEFPFVHGFWVAKEGALLESDVLRMKNTVPQISDMPEHEQGLEISYKLNEEAIESLQEFYKMAYYYGVLKDIPDVKFLSFE